MPNSNSHLKRKYNHSIINGVSNIYWFSDEWLSPEEKIFLCMNSDSQGSCKIQSEINSCFILSKLDDSNNADKDAVTHTFTNHLFTILQLLLFNSVLPPSVIEATSIFQKKFISRSFLSRKDKEVKQLCYRLPPSRPLYTGW